MKISYAKRLKRLLPDAMLDSIVLEDQLLISNLATGSD